jgi:uncharacterized protein DUF955
MDQGTLFSTAEDYAAKTLISNLLDESRLYHTTKDYKDLLDFVIRLRNFAPFNAFLLNIQKPGMRFAASHYDWRHRFKREVKEGARPLLILWPFGPVALVYDMEDTNGPDLPESVLHTFRAYGEVTEAQMYGFADLMRRNGIELCAIEFGDAHAGDIRLQQQALGLEIGERSANPKQRPLYRIRINSKHNNNVKFVSLIHELAHLFLGHLGPDKHLNIGERYRPSQSQREIEAESVAYLVCCRNGVASRSEEYLADYVDAYTTMENLDLYLIMKAAGQIETLLGLGATTSFGPKKGATQ